MNYPFDISFITINYNGLKDTCELIESLQRVVREVSFEIIVTDNCSRTDEASAIQQRYPNVTVIRSEKNLGFAGGNNIAIPYAKGRYLMFINNDTFVEEDHFRALIQRIESDAAIGMVCPKLRFAWGNRPIQFAGFTPLSNITLRNSGIGCGESDNGQYDTAHPTPFAHGAAMMVSREALDKTGPMWEGYFLYYEEMDWSSCLARAGYIIMYEPACTIFHKESKAVGIDSPLKTYYLTRNRLLYAKRNRTGMSRVACYLYLTLVAAFAHFPKMLFKGKTPQAKSIIQGLWDFYFGKGQGPK